jgi:hypothetical protein
LYHYGSALKGSDPLSAAAFEFVLTTVGAVQLEISCINSLKAPGFNP